MLRLRLLTTRVLGARVLSSGPLLLWLWLLWVGARPALLRELLDEPRVDVAVDLGAVIWIAEVRALRRGLRGGGALLLLGGSHPQDPVHVLGDVRVDLGVLFVVERVGCRRVVPTRREAPRVVLVARPLLLGALTIARVVISVVG